MAESFEKRVYMWVLGIVGTLAVSGISVNIAVLWTLNSSVVALTAKNESLTERISGLEDSITRGTQSRYTSADAASDRAAMMNLISAQSNRNTEQDSIIARLVEFKARAEERLKINGTP